MYEAADLELLLTSGGWPVLCSRDVTQFQIQTHQGSGGRKVYARADRQPTTRNARE